jgi:hypothetical protein
MVLHGIGLEPRTHRGERLLVAMLDTLNAAIDHA